MSGVKNYLNKKVLKEWSEIYLATKQLINKVSSTVPNKTVKHAIHEAMKDVISLPDES